MLKRIKADDDLFKESTMTFGEHLEELRACLFKSVLGLVAGFIIGLLFGGSVVSFIKTPLSKALTAFYQKQSLEKVDARLAELKKAGQPLPETPEDVRNLVNKERLLGEEVFVDPTDVFAQLKQAFPDRLGNFELPPKDTTRKEVGRSDLIPLFLWHSLDDDPRVKVKSLSAQEPFTIYVKAALLVGIIVASPWIFYQIWTFVGAGLYQHERRYVHIYLPFSLALFLGGAALAFFWAFEPVLNFLFSFNAWTEIDPDPRMNEWLGFVLVLPIGFGIGFQLPLVMLFLERIGVFTIKSYLSQWRIAVLAIFVVAAFLTPPDPYSMCLLAFPLTFLYFGGILLCKFMPRGRGLLAHLDE